jgi:crotonobetainyl-CoA:carnitine CoA-transferase CaiB-like acyl-CoA transferase
LVGDPHVEGRDVLIEPSWNGGSETLPMHNVVPRLSSTPGRVRSPAPRLGEHNQDVLGAFLSREELLRLTEKGVIYQDGE